MVKEAHKLENGSIRLDIGTISLIRSHRDTSDFDKGYIYNISKEQSLMIPMSYAEDNAPIFDTVSENLTTSAGSSISVKVNAESPIDMAISYQAVSLPRGATFDETSGTVTWKPTASQIGKNHFAIKAVDNDGRENTVHFTVTVYGSTTSSGNKTENTDVSTDNTGTSGGGGGGGSSGQGTTETKPDGSAEEDTGNGDTSDNADVEKGGSGVPRFNDLGNHAWAEDAINALANDDIVKGTTYNTYSPANNITRADFALLLVRTFNLSSDNAENFADVSASDYFAPELAIARNTGIVNGIGDNKYAPRNAITRQDMMVIVYRALTIRGNEPPLPKGSEAERNVGAAMNDSPVDYQNRDVTEPGERGTVEDGGGISSSDYPDYSTVAPYARDAVSALVSAGLVNGKNGLLAPTDYTTRAEVAVLLKRILDYIK